MPLPYHAGKSSLSKPISKIIMDLIKENDKITKYAEPFCGMMRVGIEVMKKGEKRLKKFYFSDVDKTITVFLKKLHDGWLPKVEDITQDKWERYKSSKSVTAQKKFYWLYLRLWWTIFWGFKTYKR